MILIVDKTVSNRAVALRERLFFLGCPCAVSFIGDSFLSSHTPPLVLTCTDVFDEVRRSTSDTSYVIAIGNGFVNSALYASAASDEDHAIHAAHAFLMEHFGIPEKNRLPFGVMLPPFYLSSGSMEVFGNRVNLTFTEETLLLLLLSSSSASKPLSTLVLSRYAFHHAAESSVAVTVSHINRKYHPYLRKPLISSAHGVGYYATINCHDLFLS